MRSTRLISALRVRKPKAKNHPSLPRTMFPLPPQPQPENFHERIENDTDVCPMPAAAYLCALAWLEACCTSATPALRRSGVSPSRPGTISSYVEDFVTVLQKASAVTVALDDRVVADYLDGCVDAGLPPQRVLPSGCTRIPAPRPSRAGPIWTPSGACSASAIGPSCSS